MSHRNPTHGLGSNLTPAPTSPDHFQPLEPRTLMTGAPGAADSALAYDTAGNLHVAYYDATAHNLKYMVQSASTGAWSTPVTVDASSKNVGQQVSIALDKNNRPSIAYRDAAKQDLKYAHFDGKKWVVSTVDSKNNTGINPSLAFDKQGHALISFYRPTNKDLVLATQVDLKTWSFTTLATKSAAGQTSSVAVDPKTGNVAVAFEGSDGKVRYADKSSSAKSFTKPVVVDAIQGGSDLSLTFGPDKKPAFTYTDPSTGEIKLAVRSGKSFNVDTVATVDSGANPGATVVINPATGKPQVVFYDAASDGMFAANSDGDLTQVAQGGAPGTPVVIDKKTGKVVFTQLSDTGTPQVQDTRVIPAAPSDVTATPASASEIDLAWSDNSDNEKSFLVQRTTDNNTWTTVATLPANSTAYADTGLSAGTTYAYRVAALGATGVKTFAADGDAALTFPAAPASLTATATSPTSVTLSWSNNQTGVDNYVVERSDDNGATFDTLDQLDASAAGYTDDTASEGTAYVYRVTATNDSGPSDPSTATVTTKVDAPGDVAGTSTSATQVSLSWINHSAHATGVVIERSADGGVHFAQIASLDPGATAFLDSTVSPGAQYTYRVHATGAAGNSANALSLATRVLPAAPGTPAATAVSTTQVNLSWTLVAGATSYVVERSADNGDTWTPIGTPVGNSFNDTSAIEASSYDYRVRAVNGAGQSANSNSAHATTFLAAPTNVLATATGTNLINVTWNDNSSGETGFVIFRTDDDGATWTQVAIATPNATLFADDTVAEGATYGYRVGAIKASVASDLTGTSSATTTLSAPSSLTVTATSLTQVDLTWSDNSTTETGFEIYRSVNGGEFTLLTTTDANATSYSDTTAAEAHTYSYKIRAINGATTSTYATPQSVITLPAAPSALAGTVVSDTRINLTWTDNSAGETGYRVEYSADNGGTWTPVTLSADSAAYAHTPATEGTTYKYRVIATNDAGDSAPSATFTATTLATAATTFAASATSPTGVHLTWSNNSTNAAGYIVERSDDSGTTFNAVSSLLSPSATSFDDITAAAGTSYVYRVLAVNSASATAASSTATALTYPAAPGSVTATAASDTLVHVSWPAVTGADTYLVERTADSGSSWTTVGTTTSALTIDDTAATEGGTFAYRVTAHNATGDSPASDPSSDVTTLPAAPTGLTATPVSATQVDLAWTDNSSHETHYRVERSADNGDHWSGIATITFSFITYSDTTASPATSYLYRVIAEGVAGDSAPSNTSAVLTVPAAPGSASAIASADTHASISWTPVTGATGYVVERSSDNGSTFPTSVTLGNVLTYADASAAEATAYVYRVRATNATGASAASPTASVTTLPAAATNLTATPVSTTRVDLAWTDNSAGESGYLVERSTDNGVNFTPLTVLSPNAATYSDTAATEGTAYVYRIKPVDITGTGAGITVNVATNPTAPSTLVATPISATQVDLTWADNSTHETGYEIRRSDDNGSTWTTVHTTAASATSWSDTTVAGGHSYQYLIRATGPGNTTSADSNTQTILTVPAAVTDLVLHVASDTTINVTWSDTTGETGYTLERFDGVSWSTVTSPAADASAFSDTTCVEGTTYTYRLTSANGTGSSAASNTPTATTLPAAPDTLAALPVNPNQIDLSWNTNSAHEDGFAIERSDDSGAHWATVHTTAAGATSWSDTTVASGTTYQYRLHAVQGSLVSADSNTDTATTAPGAVASVTPTVVSDTQIDLAWPAVTGAVSYTVERHDILADSWSTLGSPTTNSFSDTTATEATQYEYRVTAVNGTGSGASCTSSSVTTLPAAVTNVLASPVDASHVTVTWDNTSAGETAYRVERSDDAGAHWAAVHTTLPDVTTWTDATVAAGSNYAYRVYAVDATGDSADSNVSSVLTHPDQVANLTATPASDTLVNLTWDAVPTATGYLVEVSTNSGSTWSTLAANNPTTSYAHSTATEATNYLYQVTAINPTGNGAASATQPATTFAAAPTSVTATPVDDTHVTVAWADNSAGESHYKIERSDDNGQTWTLVQTTAASATSWSDATVTGGNSYSYRVTVTDAAGDSPAVDAAAPALTVPSAVTGFAGNPLSTTAIDWSWNAVHGATGYLIEISTNSGISWSTVTTINDRAVTTFHDTSLAEGTAYLYQISAIDGTGSGAATSTTATTYASAADTLVATPVSNTEVDLTWADNSNGETGYKIQRSTDNGLHWTTIHTSAADAISYNDTTAAGGTSYLYQVLATDAAGDSDPSNSSAALTIPDQVTNVTATPASDTSVTLAWDAMPGATLYTVRRSTNSGISWSTAGTTTSATTFTDTLLTESTTYTYDVIASDTTGDGADSADHDALTLPAAATNLIATGVSTTQIDLTWTDNSLGEDTYKVERSDDNGQTWTEIATPAADAVSYSDTTATEGHSYLYQVRAHNASGNSAYSASATGDSAPSAASGLAATAVDSTHVSLTWTDNSSGETGYVIEINVNAGGWNFLANADADATSYTDAAAPEGSALQYRVRAVRNATDAANSNTASATTVSAAATNLTATASAATTVDLTWTDNSAGETGYDVYRSADNGATWTKIHTTAADANSYSDTAAPEDTALLYKVVATGAGGDSADSNTAAATTPIAAATSLVASASSDTTVDLSWTDNSTVETGYKVYRSADSGAHWTLIHTTAADAVSYSDTTCAEDTTYTYKVVATDGTVDSADSNTSSALTALTAPAITGVSSPTSTSVTLTWSDNSLAEDGYKIERSDNNGVSWSVVQTTAPGVTTWTDTTLAESTLYKYQVRAYHGSNYSAYSSVSTVTTIPATPTTLTASPFSTTQIDLTWADNSAGESGYVVERSTDNGATWTDIHTTAANATSYSDSTATEASDYQYRVRATSAAGDSAESNAPSATTAPNAPIFLTVSMVGSTAILISWGDDSAGETSYEIERSTNNGVSFSPLTTINAPDTTYYTDATCTEATAYVYRVRALRNAAASDWSNSTTQVTTLPAAATNLAVTTPLSTRAVLTWTDNSAGETGYKVQRSTDNGDTWTTINTTLASAATYSDNTVSEGHSYLYQVVAFNTTGDADPSNSVTANMVPASPTGLSGSAANPNRIDLSWTDRSSAETGYSVERSTDGGAHWSEVANLPANSNSWSDSAVNESTNYQYRVRAFNTAGYSGYTASVSITTPLKAPTSLSATTLGPTAVSLSWTDNSSSETQYKIERSADNGSTWSVIATLSSNATFYTDSTASEAHAYQYRVRAAKTGNTSAYSSTALATTTPAAPTSLSATVASATQVNLTWSDNSAGETGYVVERSADNGATWTQIATPAANATSYSDTSATEGTAYTYRVKATNAGGSSAAATSSQVTTLPAAPTVLAAASPFGDTVNLSWTDNSTHETGFKIERSDDNGLTWSEIATVGANVTTYSDTTVEEATTYQYQVRANVNATNSAYSNTATVTTVPLAPDGLVATPASQTQVDLAWNDNSAGETGYKIERSDDGGQTWSLIYTTAADALTWSDTTVSEGLDYQYRIRAYNAAGDSAYSSTAEALTPPAAPSNLAASVVSTDEVDLAWTDNSVGEDGFTLERQTDGGTWDLLDTLTPDSNSYADTTVTTGHTYAYRLRAFNSTGDSPNSNTDSATL